MAVGQAGVGSSLLNRFGVTFIELQLRGHFGPSQRFEGLGQKLRNDAKVGGSNCIELQRLLEGRTSCDNTALDLRLDSID